MGHPAKISEPRSVNGLPKWTFTIRMLFEHAGVRGYQPMRAVHHRAARLAAAGCICGEAADQHHCRARRGRTVLGSGQPLGPRHRSSAQSP